MKKCLIRAQLLICAALFSVACLGADAQKDKDKKEQKACYVISIGIKS